MFSVQWTRPRINRVLLGSSLLVALAWQMLPGLAWAQEGAITPVPAAALPLQESSAAIEEASSTGPRSREATPSTPGQKWIRYSTMIGFPLAVTIYGQQAWDWGNQGSWNWGTEGFFGRDTGLGGADKLGHAWACYAITRGSHAIFDYTENGRPEKLWYAGAVAALIGTGIEVGDAFNGHYGFAWEDIVADYTGIALGLLMETYPQVDALLGYSVFYWPTDGYLDYPDKTVLNLEGDSSGWTYMLNLKPAGLDHVGVDASYLRYVTLDLGYFTRGYTEYDRAAGVMDQARSWFVGVSLNVPEVVDAMFARSNSRANRMLRAPFNYFHLPLGFELASAID